MSVSIIWTKHVLRRLAERRLSQERVEKTLLSPDRRAAGKQRGTTEYIRRDGTQTVTAVAHKNSKGEFVVVSAWVDPPFAGTKDARQKTYYQRYKQASFLGKFWYLFLKQIGWW